MLLTTVNQKDRYDLRPVKQQAAETDYLLRKKETVQRFFEQ